jgi:hypothetical protein
MPLEAKSETSGTSRAPSAGFPKMPDCQEGLAYPAQLETTKSGVPLVPVAHPLGPPAPALVVR